MLLSIAPRKIHPNVGHFDGDDRLILGDDRYYARRDDGREGGREGRDGRGRDDGRREEGRRWDGRHDAWPTWAGRSQRGRLQARTRMSFANKKHAVQGRLE